MCAICRRLFFLILYSLKKTPCVCVYFLFFCLWLLHRSMQYIDGHFEVSVTHVCCANLCENASEIFVACMLPPE